MPAKKSYIEIKAAFLFAGFEMVSTGYVNSRSPIYYICSKGHFHSMTWNSFQRGQRCGVCNGKHKHTTEYVQNYIQSFGYSLLSVYVNSKVSIKLCCPEGHVYSTCWNYFRTGDRCPGCSKFRRKDFDFYREFLFGLGYELLAVDFLGGDCSLVFRCGNAHTCESKWRNILRGCECKECVLDRKRVGVTKARFAITERGYTPLFNTYKNAFSKLKMQCDKGHIFHMTWNVFSLGAGCSVCTKNAVSKISQEWLDSLNVSPENREVLIKHPSRKRGFRVDGFDPKTNTVYEFLGDFWHGNPEKFPPEDINPVSKKSFGELHRRTFRRFAKLEEAGYNIVFIWEQDYKEGLNGQRKRTFI